MSINHDIAIRTRVVPFLQGAYQRWILHSSLSSKIRQLFSLTSFVSHLAIIDSPTMPSDRDSSFEEKPAQQEVEVGRGRDGVVEDPERQRKEKALVRKLDLFIAPVMMLLMLISYLDRSNIGFAATQGMTEDINLKGSQLNVCNTIRVALPPLLFCPVQPAKSG